MSIPVDNNDANVFAVTGSTGSGGDIEMTEEEIRYETELMHISKILFEDHEVADKQQIDSHVLNENAVSSSGAVKKASGVTRRGTSPSRTSGGTSNSRTSGGTSGVTRRGTSPSRTSGGTSDSRTSGGTSGVTSDSRTSGVTRRGTSPSRTSGGTNKSLIDKNNNTKDFPHRETRSSSPATKGRIKPTPRKMIPTNTTSSSSSSYAHLSPSHQRNNNNSNNNSNNNNDKKHSSTQPSNERRSSSEQRHSSNIGIRGKHVPRPLESFLENDEHLSTQSLDRGTPLGISI
jgi:hypothetical protein